MKGNESMQKYTDGMTLEELIGQLLVFGFPSTTPSPEIIDLIQRQHIGNIILFSRNVHDTQQLRALTRSLQNAAQEAGHRYPLQITIDHENGMVQRLGSDATIFPGNMALGAIGSEPVVYAVAQAAGHELHALGITMNLAPVVDVNNNPANPVIGIRSFGEDPQHVARFGAATVKGYHSAGIMTCLKHFPGHGDTAVDSHLALPTIPHSLERLEALELIPFIQGIAASADAIMTAHVAFPAITHDAALPATLSPAILQGLLREKLGYDGVIISDCLEMKAISETVGVGRGTVMALQAGIDLVLVSHLYERQQASISSIHAALQSGELSPDMIRQSAERVLRLKARFLSWDALIEEDGIPSAHSIGGPSHQQLRDRAYEISTTLVKNDENLLPLHLDSAQRIAVLYPVREIWTRVTDKDHSPARLVESIRQRHDHVIAVPFLQGSTNEEILQATTRADLFIIATINANLDAQQAELMQYLLNAGRTVIGIATYNPYDLLAFPELGTYLVTYENTPPALAAAVRVLFGEVKPRGHLPVSLPGL